MDQISLCTNMKQVKKCRFWEERPLLMRLVTTEGGEGGEVETVTALCSTENTGSSY